MTRRAGFSRFAALRESDAPNLLQRMSKDDLPVDGERYGVTTRLVARPNVGVADLGIAVLGKLFDVCSIGPQRLGAMVLSSRIREVQRTAEVIANRLNIAGSSYGIERACSGFPAATQLGLRLCKRLSKPVAIVTVEIISTAINWEPATGDLSDHRRARGQAAKLFGDGAAAVLIVPSGHGRSHEILDAWVGEVPDKRQLIQKADIENSLDPWGHVRPGLTGCISMPGRRGFLLVKRAPQLMVSAILQSLENGKEASCVGEDETLGHVVPHQANGLIVSALETHLAEQLDPPPTVWNCIQHAGNTVSASIPLAMTEVQTRLSPGTLVGMPTVGAGGPGYRPDVLSTGCILVRMSAR